MMGITREANASLATGLGKPAAELTRIGCITCHRGVPEPKQIGEILSATSAEKGFAAAAAQYNELKTKYYGAQAYDFSDAGLIATAQPLVPARADEAIQFLRDEPRSVPAIGPHLCRVGRSADGEERHGGSHRQSRESARDRAEQRRRTPHARPTAQVIGADEPAR